MRINPTLPKTFATATLGLALVASACSATDSTDDTAAGMSSAAVVSDSTGELALAASAGIDSNSTVALFDSAVVHDIEIEYDQDAYDAMIETYETTGEKDWIEATITIDGTTIENVGLRLKGNSSLFGLTSETAENPEDLPWLIRFDKYVDDQTYQGYGDLVIRSNSTETAMNEAVALELLETAGLATEEAIATTFTVNGGETELRLAIEHPDEVWAEANFDSDDGLLYKADSEGDYSYRGDDPDAYDDVFNQKAGDDDLEPLIEFLDFINNSDDATFADELSDELDVEAFATYLAFQELVGNFDDIDGPGNNSYLYYDPDTDRFTVVNWDLNLAFDTANVNGGGPGAGGQGGGRVGPPAGPPQGQDLAAGGPAGGTGPLGGNILAERFMANDDFAQLYADAISELTETMYNSGTAADIIDGWAEVLTEQAGDLVDESTIRAEADAILTSIQSA
ncbi:MAG: CotH kinase family protein [Acidimicrobiales bacterium]